ncbi:MAG TPA: hypothetical protein VLE71_02960 [Actinomycetota bacterium]|nr:hypothetical protein [Actinomycetota bacterium]
MSDRLRQSLMSSRSEIEAGLAEAGAELARVRQRAAELEELIALGTATLLAAEMISGGAKNAPADATTGSPAPESSAVPGSPSEPEPAQGVTYEDDLRALLERAQP